MYTSRCIVQAGFVARRPCREYRFQSGWIRNTIRRGFASKRPCNAHSSPIPFLSLSFSLNTSAQRTKYLAPLLPRNRVLAFSKTSFWLQRYSINGKNRHSIEFPMRFPVLICTQKNPACPFSRENNGIHWRVLLKFRKNEEQCIRV